MESWAPELMGFCSVKKGTRFRADSGLGVLIATYVILANAYGKLWGRRFLSGGIDFQAEKEHEICFFLQGPS